MEDSPSEESQNMLKYKKHPLKDLMSYRLFNILYPANPTLIPREKLHRFSVAPMMEVTDTHFRVFMRLLTRCATLWTEMYHSSSINLSATLKAQ